MEMKLQKESVGEYQELLKSNEVVEKVMKKEGEKKCWNVNEWAKHDYNSASSD